MLKISNIDFTININFNILHDSKENKEDINKFIKELIDYDVSGEYEVLKQTIKPLKITEKDIVKNHLSINDTYKIKEMTETAEGKILDNNYINKVLKRKENKK